jgi:hypothetical protein
MEPEKSSIGEISSKISSRPEVVGTSCRPPRERPRHGPATSRCRGASRSCPSEGPGGSGPPVAHGSCRRRYGRTPYGGTRRVTRCARRPRGVLPRACGRYVRTPRHPRADAWGRQSRAQSPRLPHCRHRSPADTWCRLTTARSRSPVGASRSVPPPPNISENDPRRPVRQEPCDGASPNGRPVLAPRGLTLLVATRLPGSAAHVSDSRARQSGNNTAGSYGRATPLARCRRARRSGPGPATTPAAALDAGAAARRCAPVARAATATESLDRDGGAGALEGGPGLVRGVLVDAARAPASGRRPRGPWPP